MKSTAMKLSRKICGTHFPEPLPPVQQAQLGENSQRLTSFWGREEEWNISPMFLLFQRLPKGLVSVLPESNCWQEQGTKLGAAKNKGNQCAPEHSTTAYCSTREAAVQEKDISGELLSRNWESLIRQLHRQARKGHIPESAWEVSRISRLTGESPPCTKWNCKDWKRWKILQMLKPNRR